MRHCAFCDAEIPAVPWNRRFCAPSCRDAFYHHGGRPARRACIVCGTELDFVSQHRNGKRLRKHTVKCFDCRRDQRYELTTAQLAERDGTDCALCGEPVDLTLAWPDKWSPTRDHVVPVTHGGGNDAANLQLAHLSCNSRKGNRVPR
jgi:5-methylcytosine-specific restriction endonuclease McrA